MHRKRNWRSQLLGLMIVGVLWLPQLGQALSFNPVEGQKFQGITVTTGNIELVDLGKNEPTLVAYNIINAALSLLAALCLVLLIYAGFLWVWAKGNQDEVKKAKDIIIGTVLGLIVVLASLGITTFVFQTVAKISGATVTS